MRMLLHFILFLSLNVQHSSAQDSLSNKFNLQVGLTRMDIFGGLQYAKKIHSFQPFSALEIGINRTIFQSRFYSKISVGSAFFVFDKKKFKIGPQLSYAYSVLKVNKQSSHVHQWNELYAGLYFELGEKIRFVSQFSGGWMNERYFSQIEQKNTGVNSFGYNVKLGLCYAW